MALSKNARTGLIAAAVVVGILLLGLAALLIASKIRCGTLAAYFKNPKCLFASGGGGGGGTKKGGGGGGGSKCSDVATCLASTTGQPCGAVPRPMSGDTTPCTAARGQLVNGLCVLTSPPSASIAGTDGYLTMTQSGKPTFYIATATPSVCTLNPASDDTTVAWTPFAGAN